MLALPADEICFEGNWDTYLLQPKSMFYLYEVHPFCLVCYLGRWGGGVQCLLLV